MKHFFKTLTLAALLLTNAAAFSQTATELVFKNPVLESGTDKQLGATYRFSNIRPGFDALLTIASVSNETVVINTIDLTTYGWDKAFQPEIGKAGNVPANQSWWVRFNIKFVAPNTAIKKTLDKFYATAIDVDGDQFVIQEFFQVYKPDSTRYRTGTQLTSVTPFNAGLANTSKDVKSMGPIQNYGTIDTAATQVMVTHTFLNTDEINVVYGAKVGHGISNAGMRLNSLWFRSFNMNTNIPLAIRSSDFTLSYDKKNVNLQWKIFAEENITNMSIEKSTDGVNFETAARLAATGNQLVYNYTDAAPSAATGVVYYRILYRDKSGEGKYSGIKMVRLSKEAGASLSVYPNPLVNAANLTLPTAWQGKAVTVSVYNSAGNQVYQQAVATASQTETVSFNRLPTGVYLIKVACGNAVAEQRVIKN